MDTMALTGPITFVTAVNNREIFENNFSISPCFRRPHDHQIIVQENANSAAKAYNDAIDRSVNDLIIFAHQDIVFPPAWLGDLRRALDFLKTADPGWGVLGCFGITADEQPRGHIYSGGLGVIGAPLVRPTPVQTLDEIVLVIRKSSGLRFDERLPHFHFYGADLCMQAAAKGMNNYAIPAFCIHNAQFNLVLPSEFYQCYRYMRRKWRGALPINTTCVTVSRFNGSVYKRRFWEICLRNLGRTKIGDTRLKDPRQLLSQFESASSIPSPEFDRHA